MAQSQYCSSAPSLNMCQPSSSARAVCRSQTRHVFTGWSCPRSLTACMRHFRAVTHHSVQVPRSGRKMVFMEVAFAAVDRPTDLREPLSRHPNLFQRQDDVGRARIDGLVARLASRDFRADGGFFTHLSSMLRSRAGRQPRPPDGCPPAPIARGGVRSGTRDSRGRPLRSSRRARSGSHHSGSCAR